MDNQFTQSPAVGGEIKATFVGPRRRFQRLDLLEHLASGSPKRILSLDAGGIRTTMTIAILEHLEGLLRKRHGGDRSFRLSDYFDLIGGSSTGGFVAAMLATGKYSMADIREIFFEVAPQMYRRRLFGRSDQRQFNGRRLEKQLEMIFGDLSLGEDRLTTGLAILARRVDTDETMVMHNHPHGKFFNAPPRHKSVSYSKMRVVTALMAAMSTPQQFSPELVTLARHPHRIDGLFVDGSVSPHYNPAFQLYLLSTLKGHGFEWPTGPEKLLFLSVGTGALCRTIDPQNVRRTPALMTNRDGITAMMDGADHTSELMMQLMSEPDNPSWIDTDVGDLRDQRLTDTPQMSYQRYQPKLQREDLRKKYGLALNTKQLAKVRTMTDTDGLQIAYEIGQAVAHSVLDNHHLPKDFDLPHMIPAPIKTDHLDQPAAQMAGGAIAASLEQLAGPSLSQSPSVRARPW